MKKKTKNKDKHFYTRKNYIIISASLIFAFLMMFVGFCLDANYTIMNKNNPIALLAKSMNLPQIKAGLSGIGALLIFALYIILATWLIVSLVRYRHNIGKSTYSLSAFGFYALAFVVSFGLATLISYIIFAGSGLSNFQEGMTFIGESFLVTLLITLVLGLLIVGVVGVALNYAKVGKPFTFFKDKGEELGDLDETSDKEEEDKKDENENKEDSDQEDDDKDAAKAFGDTSGEGGTAGNGVGGVASGALTAQGDNAVENLDDRSKVFPALYAIDEKYSGEEVPQIVSSEVSLKELAVGFRNYLAKAEHLYYSQNTINAFLAGFASSRLEILEGLSGTGKSSLPRYFAKYTSSKAIFLPVQSSWRDKTSILGYFNDFSKSYHETDFLRSLYEASYNPDQLTFFVLDEMNISRIEYYFADFLSVLEYPSDAWKIRLMQLPYGFLPPLHLEDGLISIPTNSYFVGTANKDDSTFQISNKVYDRAFTINFRDRNKPFDVKEEVSPITLSTSHLQSLYQEAKDNPSLHLTEEEKNTFRKITDYIGDEFDVLFGNRVEDQIEAFVPVFVACGGSKEDALDALLDTKLISKLEGRFEDNVKDGLYHLTDLLDDTYGKEKFPLSHRSISSLLKKL